MEDWTKTLLEQLRVLLKKPQENIIPILNALYKAPSAKINRTDFLKKELSNRNYDKKTIEIAIKSRPAKAGISLEEIDDIAESCINFETSHVTLLSASAGIPGGFAMLLSVPADVVQYYIHVLRIIQKLAYLYGWQEISNKDEIDDETKNKLLFFMAKMLGIAGANKLLKGIIETTTPKIAKNISCKHLTKGTIYPIVKKISNSIGLRMSKQLFGKNVSNLVPIAGALISGGLTYFTYRNEAKKLKRHLSKLPFADINYNGEDETL